MAARIMIVNGPNLNFLGIREPHIYGSTTLKEIEASCQELAKYLGISISFHQSNLEGELVNLIQSAHGSADAIPRSDPAAVSVYLDRTDRCPENIRRTQNRGSISRIFMPETNCTGTRSPRALPRPSSAVSAHMETPPRSWPLCNGSGSCRTRFRRRCEASGQTAKLRCEPCGEEITCVERVSLPSGAMSSGLKILTDYRHWLTREHTTERVTTKGFLAGRVFRAARADIERFFILYDQPRWSCLHSRASMHRRRGNGTIMPHSAICVSSAKIP